MVIQSSGQTALLLGLLFAVASLETWVAQARSAVPGSHTAVVVFKTWAGFYMVHMAGWWARTTQMALRLHVVIFVAWFQFANLAFRPHIPEQTALVDYVTLCLSCWATADIAWIAAERFLGLRLRDE
jgi:hypothetical protein